MKNILLLLAILFSYKGFSQVKNCNYPIMMTHFCKCLIPENLLQESKLNLDLGDYIIRGILIDCKGAMEIEVFYYEDTSLVAKGQYVNSLDLLKEYNYFWGPDGDVIEVFEYYRPLKDGTWYYYDENDNVSIKEYVNGVEKSFSIPFRERMYDK